ncbi:MAG: Calx-beta domain-containing protein, partial [Planctomycetota bacterium]
MRLESLETRIVLSGNGGSAQTHWAKEDATVDSSVADHDEFRIGYSPLDKQDDDPTGDVGEDDPQLLARMNEVFNLQSKPDSDFTIYLDFDGHVMEGAQWNAGTGMETIVLQPYDVDGNDSFFNSTELSRMHNAWKRTAEDFAAFDVNVTTIDPGVDRLIRSSSSDPQWGIRVVSTRDTFADCGCGGHAYINSFNYDNDTPALVYNRGDGSLGETISHEIGHAINLSHDGLSDTTYYGGHGSGSTSWGAIMGAPFNEEITQWDQAEYFDANNTGASANYNHGFDDLDVITSENGFGYRADDHSNQLSTSTELDVQGNTTLSGFGIIERNTDVDYFSFVHAGGSFSLSANALNTRPNLDIWMGIYDASGNLVAQSNRSNDQDAVWGTGNLPAGTYYVKIDGVGTHGIYDPATDSVRDPANPPWQNSSPLGYSDYGSLGQYWISGTIQAAPNLVSVSVDPLVNEGDAATVTVTRSGDISSTASVDLSIAEQMPTTVGATYPNTVNAQDFSGPMSQTLSFAAGQSEITLQLQTTNDAGYEPDEHFVVRLSNASSGMTLGHSVAQSVIVTDESRIALKPISSNEFAQREGDAFADSVVLRWRQVRFSSDDSDNWGLDNVSLSNSSLNDNFQDGVDPQQWGRIQNGTVNNTFSGGSDSLYFTGAGTRAATTRIVNPMPGDVVSFDLIFSDGSNGGENADAGEDVTLEYSTDNGSTWRELSLYDTEDYTSWTRINAALPEDITTGGMTRYTYELERTGSLTNEATASWQFTGSGISNRTSADDFVGGQFPLGQVVFASGESTKTISVDINRDSEFETDERFALRLNTASSANSIEIHNGFRQVQGVVRNDDSFADLKTATQFRWIQDPSASGGDSDVWGLDNIEIASAGLSDDFDPSLDSSQWQTITGRVANLFTGGSGNEMHMDGGHPRQAVTRSVDVASDDMIRFDLIFGNNQNGGENANGGEDVYLEMSLNGGNDWLHINTYDTEEYVEWTTLTEPIPVGATSDLLDQAEGESETTYTVTLFRTGDIEKFVMVDWQVTGTGANPATDSDFVGGSLPTGTVVFNPGSTVATVEVVVAGDTIAESDETFALSLVASSGGTTGSSQVVATIRNDDTLSPGDFDGNGTWDCQDIDQLVAAVANGNGDLQFDLNADGIVSLEDVDSWLVIAGNINEGGPYLGGDANLDGSVDVSDFNVWNNNKFTSTPAWCSGDFYSDGAVDVSDFNVWNNNK